MQNRVSVSEIGGDEASEREFPRNSGRGFAGKNESAWPSSGTYPVSVPVPSALERFALPPRVLVGLPKNPTRSELVRTLHSSGRMRVLEFDPTRADWPESLRPQIVDVAVLHAGCLNPNCAALLHDPDFGFPELVFAIDDGCPAQRLALLSRGYKHVISNDHLATWLPDQLASLCTLARARRIVLEACSAKMPVADLTLGSTVPASMNLHLAETNFREIFLRALLTEHGSRRRAAEAAGVPYRSFCEMLRKLCIET